MFNLKYALPWLALALPALPGCAPQSLMDLSPGPHQVVVRDEVIHDAGRGRDISLRVAYPAEGGRYPVVVFSHGAFCYPQHYAQVTDHWVSHGYIVLSPDHLDSPNNPRAMGPDQVATLLESRIEDLTLVTDYVAQFAAAADVKAKPDLARMAIAGHSFGGMLAQIKAGLLLKDPRTGEQVSRADPRYGAAVIMSGVGPMPQMADDAFSGLKGPLIASGGTLDVGNVGSGQIFPWEWRMSPYTLAPPGNKYSLVLEEADHYLGGLICRPDRGGGDDAQGVAIVRAVQVTFLDAYLKEDGGAKHFLESADVAVITQGRATLEHK